MPHACVGAVAVAALVIGIAPTLTGTVPVRPPEGVDPSLAPGPADPSAANLSVVIDPTSWWMESGTNATFSATWAGTPAGCAVAPTWYRWSIGSGGAEGSLGSSNGSGVTFFASDQGTGTTTVVVRAAAVLRCHGTVSAAFARAPTSVTVAAPLTVRGLVVTPDPIAPGGSTDLEGSLVGGDPPYRLRVAWGDGNVSYANVSPVGTFSVPHTFAGSGTYAPELLASDAAGEDTAGSLEEPLYVSPGFAAAIAPSALVTEVGVPVLFNVSTIAAPRNFSSVFACEDAAPVGEGNGSPLAYGCEFDHVGISSVTFSAVGSRTPFAEASATLDEAVRGPPVVGGMANVSTAEVGTTSYAALELTGGVPPFTVDWSLVGAGTSGVQADLSDGTDYIPLDSDSAGTFVLSVVSVDALGVASPAATGAVTFAPALTVYATARAEVDNGSVELNVSGGATEGTGPFDWTVVPGVPAVNGSAEAGALAGIGTFTWNATYRLEGSLPITVSVVDSAGGSAVVNLSVVLATPLAVVASVGPTRSGGVTLTMTISGGVGPFTYRWNDSAGDLWNGTAPEGTRVLRETTTGRGPLEFELAVVDAVGASDVVDLAANVTAAPSATTAGSMASTAAVVAALLAVGAAVAVLRRRRTPATALPPSDPVAVLREVIEPSDGVDRGLVEMLAEERGVALEVVRSTLERLKADGTVRSGRGSDGEEVLAWTLPAER